ncbi:alpha/beta hydrolase family protein [Tellurirhabdus bombi]|uniref:alpha/beta hydrolase family protein n=1 Tax=Tellurirhabdus bombi TaxID=2907205 RepID=UPI001F2814E7|nr:hypothetical protein [Tellurirhabdus bombi]
MKVFLVFAALFSFVYYASSAQTTPRSIGNYSVFTIPFDGDSVTFAVTTPPGKLLQKKPIFLFRQGSLPIPLFEQPTDRPPVLIQLPAACYAHDEYYSITIAKPGLPLVVNSAYVDTLFSTLNNPKAEMYPKKYMECNYLDYYVRQTNAVLDFVLKQPWADPSKVVLTGGSEGYHVAIKTASQNKQVTHLIAFSGNLEGRLQSIIRAERAKAFAGQTSHEEAQRSIEALQQEWAEICRDSLGTERKLGDNYRTTYSFSNGDGLDHLLSLQIPICILYGTADVGATSNDILPLEFARRGKKNLTLKAYPSHDHTFFKLTYDAAGKVSQKTYNGDAVEKDYFDWLAKH